MVYKILYKRKLKRREVVVPDADIWSGLYLEKMRDAYFQHKDVYKVTEFREGLVISLPSEVVDALDLPEIEYETKSKMKISEVFKRCQNAEPTVKPNSLT